MDLYDIAVAKSLAGGGGSDLTSATMTIAGGTVQMNAPICFDFSTIQDAPFPGCIFTNTQSYDDGEYKVALFKGNAMCFISTENITVSGSIQDFGGGAYLVSGDCTITIS